MTSMNLPNLFFLDFDGTLFNTKMFWEAVQMECTKTRNIPEATFLDTYAQSKSEKTIYDIDKHIQLLGLSKEDVQSIFTSLFQRNSYIYPDVLPFLGNHSSDTVVILTQGVAWFQEAKIASLPPHNPPLRVIVTDYKKRHYIENAIGFYEDGVLFEGDHYKSLIFVDNMADAFLPEEHGDAFRQYRIRRNDDPHADEPTRKGSIEITTLLDI